MKSLNKNILVMAIAAVVSGQVAAYEAGDWILRAGYAAVDPRENADNLKANGAALSGTDVGVDGAGALGLTGVYMFTSHWGVELLAASPFEHDVYTKGLSKHGLPDVKLGSVKQLPPTVSAQYYFFESASQWQPQPYVGLGINYTTFFDESVSGEAKSQLGASNLSLDDSIGVAGEIGVDWSIDQHWLINAAVWRIQIESDASVDTAVGKVKTTVSLDPWVYMFSVGYKF